MSPNPQTQIRPRSPRDQALLLDELVQNRNLLLCDALRILGARDRAEDVLQEAALRALGRNSGETLRDGRHFARRMVRNLAIDRLRRERWLAGDEALERQPSAGPDVERCLAGRELLGRVEAQLRQCRARDREVFLRHRVMGEPQNLLAREFNLSPARVHAIVTKIHKDISALRIDEPA
ncbi:sigma-70 family RNA polymerase sigma factor [Paracoccus aminophilus]|uniref:ECF subfamily RNA polymerase sigma-19 factor n=1 Tax=Paracoccus aminophilus JCM 7686 TaxID=1367847 RepID=S5Y4T5_PARAH|nr:sigma-70 family RNA polymerase sigma factor [Paracoccus aminophilus]AGT10750.1 ECF subfamily RNA polymerase sigma-19 factor [Paracoccus aminophilus JCM 7686]